MTQNTLFYGDNLAILREHITDASVDLVYLDRPLTPTASITCSSGLKQGELL